jgi:hypothetical protein
MGEPESIVLSELRQTQKDKCDSTWEVTRVGKFIECLGYCISVLSITIMKYPRQATYKEKRFGC